MRLIDSICRMPVIVALIITIGCAVPGCWRMAQSAAPALLSVAGKAIRGYDARLPQITVRGGRISITREQPWHSYPFGTMSFPLVIDTRDTSFRVLLEHLNNYDLGAVLSRNLIIVKNGVREYVFPLSDLPDLVIDSGNLETLVAPYLSRVAQWVPALAVLLVAVVQFLGVAFLGLGIFMACRWRSVPRTYLESLKLASMVMIPVGILGFCLC